MKLLPAEQHTFAYEGDCIVAGLHEHNGRRWYSRYLLDDRQPLPSGDDLKGAIVDEIDSPATRQLQGASCREATLVTCYARGCRQ
jgi:hypothetical protein